MDELYKIIPDSYAQAIKPLCLEKVCELKIVGGGAVKIDYGGKYYFLGSGGLTDNSANAFIADGGEPERVVMRACNRSLFTVTETLKKGYIALSGGLRVGVCGEGVMADGKLFGVKNFSSVTVRIPHEVKGCASNLYTQIVTDRIKNTLIVSPPGRGKTTMLRDLCRIISSRGYNVSLIDEKKEIAAMNSGVPALDVGRADVISGVDKPTAMDMAITNMRPDVIITDELAAGDMDGVMRALTCGVAVICSVHAFGADDIKRKLDIFGIDSRVFDCFVTLSGAPSRTVTVIEGEL